MLDLSALARSGASAVVAAVDTDAWSWVRAEMSRFWSRDDSTRQSDVAADLDGFVAELSTVGERDVQNRLHGYFEARLGDDAALQEQFFILLRKISTELGIEPPVLRNPEQVNASRHTVVQPMGGDAHVHAVLAPVTRIRWSAMTAREAARKLESLDLNDAVAALADMEPTLGARRLSHVRVAWAQELLSHMDEGIALDLLTKVTTPEQVLTLLTLMKPTHAAAILDLAKPDWAVSRLAEMDPDRAIVLLASMGTKRTEYMLEAMERQQTVRLLAAVSKVLADQSRVRTTFDLAQREAERIAALAREEARITVDRANAEAEAIKATVQRELTTSRLSGHQAVGQLTVEREGLEPPPTHGSSGDDQPPLPSSVQRTRNEGTPLSASVPPSRPAGAPDHDAESLAGAEHIRSTLRRPTGDAQAEETAGQRRPFRLATVYSALISGIGGIVLTQWSPTAGNRILIPAASVLIGTLLFSLIRYVSRPGVPRIAGEHLGLPRDTVLKSASALSSDRIDQSNRQSPAKKGWAEQFAPPGSIHVDDWEGIPERRSIKKILFNLRFQAPTRKQAELRAGRELYDEASKFEQEAATFTRSLIQAPQFTQPTDQEH